MENKNEHDILFLHCATCKKDTMQVQISDKHGMVVSCYNCKISVFNATDGDHFDVLLGQALGEGCSCKNEHQVLN